MLPDRYFPAGNSKTPPPLELIRSIALWIDLVFRVMPSGFTPNPVASYTFAPALRDISASARTINNDLFIYLYD
jgi:hypothetical protein